jgi:hypothetical protein
MLGPNKPAAQNKIKEENINDMAACLGRSPLQKSLIINCMQLQYRVNPTPSKTPATAVLETRSIASAQWMA